ncbi:OmpA family protein [Candidatus Sumerlaeota bacterium]|nr:OmpA family protein [Candidatus Sumerlaeota bacterium]
MRPKPRPELTVDFWPSFTDALLSVVLVLVFVVTVFVATQTHLVTALNRRENALALLSDRLGTLERTLQLSKEEALRLQNELGRTEKTLTSTFETLVATRGDLEASREEIEAARAGEEAQRATAQAGLRQIGDLTRNIEAYLNQIRSLNRQLDENKKNLDAKDASLKDLNSSVQDLGGRVALLSSQLGESKENLESQKLELAKLLDELEARNTEIQRLKTFEKYRSEFLARLVDVFSGVENIRLSGDRFVFQSEVLFASGSADLTESGKQKLDTLYETYKALESKIPRDVGFNIQIQGHTDTDPIVRAKFASNWELSTARATEVVRYLIRKGIPAGELSAAGFGEFYPATPGTSAETKRQNRRIEIFFTRR